MKALTDRTVKTVPPGRYGDGTVKGLMLVVRESGARGWVLRYQIGRRRRDMGLGPYPEVGLADARDARWRTAGSSEKASTRSPIAAGPSCELSRRWRKP
jgi:hypothetical protein